LLTLKSTPIDGDSGKDLLNMLMYEFMLDMYADMAVSVLAEGCGVMGNVVTPKLESSDMNEAMDETYEEKAGVGVVKGCPSAVLAVVVNCNVDGGCPTSDDAKGAPVA
jgi:hypothetical protein